MVFRGKFRGFRPLEALLLPLTLMGCLCLPQAGAQARPLEATELPPELAPWVGWLKARHPDLECAVVNGSSSCLWPGLLRIEAHLSGASFEYALEVDRKLSVPLPGGRGLWPQSVLANGQAMPVLTMEERPFVTLPAGAWRVTGAFVWETMPQRLPLPAQTGIVALSLEGKAVAFPKIDAEGGLRLGEGTSSGPRGNTLELEVSRKLTDGIPFLVTTRIGVRASGAGREVDLGKVLVPETRPVSLSADLPARLTPDRSLVLQIRPGSFTVTIEAIRLEATSVLKPPSPGEHWPESEYWVVERQDTLRAINVSGVDGVDPARTSVPEEWRTLPCYLMRPDSTMTLEELRRGEAEPPPNQLTLHRSLRLDLDGKGMSIQDTFSGTLYQGWRLEASPPADLGHVVDQGKDQVITLSNERAGVELRRSSVGLVAESRLEAFDGRLPAVGWGTDVTQLSADLHLPPGWTLLAARGVDSESMSVLERWTLFDLFFVLMMALAMGKLFGWKWGAVALGALALARHSEDAPVWIWVWLLVVAALLRVVKEGRAFKVLRGTRLLLLMILFVTLLLYAIVQVRTAFAPALERAWAAADSPNAYWEGEKSELAGGFLLGAREMAPAAPQDVLQDERYSQLAMEANDSLSKLDASVTRGDGGKLRKKSNLQWDPAAVVQTGAGVANWSWKTASLRWTGPVTSEQTLTLYLMGPTGQAVVHFLRLALLLLLSLQFAGIDTLKKWLRRPAANGLFALLFAFCVSSSAQAEEETVQNAAPIQADPAQSVAPDVPPPGPLAELEERLLEPPSCRPACLSVSVLTLRVEGEVLTFQAEVHAGEATSWPVPGPVTEWLPASIQVDGRQTGGLSRLSDGFLHVRLEAGVHTVTGQGRIQETDSITLQLGVLPARVQFASSGWTLDGVRGDGTVERSIQLTRLMETGGVATARSSENLEPWIEVHRVLDLGLPWLMTTTVRRHGPGTTPLSLRIPLIAGEAVTDERLEAIDGKVAIALDRDQSEVSWESTLARAEELTLTAPTGSSWTERWTLLCRPLFSCQHEGLVPISHTASGEWAPEWLPLPGEQLTLRVSQPGAKVGQTMTVDSALLHLTPGERMTQAVLNYRIRTSQGGQQRLELPEGAKVQSVSVGTRQLPGQLKDRALSIPLEPGAQEVSVSWQMTSGQGVWEQVPPVNLGVAGVNLSVKVDAAPNRWTLWLRGPAWGPVPLFWSFVLIVLLAAPLLARLPFAGLSTTQWLLVGLGLTALDPLAPLAVVLWFILLGYRKERPPERWWTFDLLQLLLVGWTVAAMAVFYLGTYQGLLSDAPARIEGNGSTRYLFSWFIDRSTGLMPQPTIVSVPMWVWRVLMLLWSIWLAWSLVKWFPRAWSSFSSGGLWKKRKRGATVAAALPPPGVPLVAPPTPPRAKDVPPPIEGGAGDSSS